MRRPLALLVALGVVVSACSGSHDRPPLERVTGTIGASGTDGGAGSTDGAGTASTATTQPAATTSTVAADAPARLAAADAALAAYFDALQSEDFAAARRVSRAGAQLMVTIRDAVARYNAERDGVSELSYSARSFTAATNESGRVTYTGRAQLDSTVSGPAGDPHRESARFEDPVVTLVDGAWRVTEFRYDGEPLAHRPATSSRTVGGVQLHLEGALSFGHSTGLVIDLVTDADHDIKVDKARLVYADGTSATPTLGALISKKPAALYFLFERVASPPVRWTATVTIDAGTTTEASADVVLAL